MKAWFAPESGFLHWSSRSVRTASDGRMSRIAEFVAGRCSPSAYWKVISRHLETSEPSPDEMVMQPRTF